MVVWDDVVLKVQSLIIDLLMDYSEQIKTAYNKVLENEAFTISFTVKLKPDQGGIGIIAGIGFIESRVKDSIEAFVSGQQTLPGVEKAVKKFKDELAGDGMEVKGVTEENGTPAITITMGPKEDPRITEAIEDVSKLPEV